MGRLLISNRALRTLGFGILALLLSIGLYGCEREPSIERPNSITVGSLADAKRLLPLLASDSSSAEISGLVFNGLVKYDKDLKLTSDLAESWDVTNGGLEIIFHLRKGVNWHDGVEFTAEDVIFTYEAVTDPDTPTAYGSNYGPVNSVKALDRYTVRVTYSEPFAPALESWGMGIIPKHLLEGTDLGASEYNRNPIGTGPYRFKEWVTGQRIVLEANDDYFEGRPKIDKFISRVIPDTATMFLELKHGGIDFMDLTPIQYKLQGESQHFKKYFQKFRYPAFSYTYLGYNLNNPMFQDKRVRRALTHAINKKDIIKGVLLGFGTPCTGPFPPESWAFNPNVNEPEYNVDKAKALFKEAGWEPGTDGILRKDGQKFHFTILTNQGNTLRAKTAEIIQQNLKAVGVEMEVKTLEWQALLHDFIDERKFEAIIIGWALSRDPDAYDIWYSEKTGPKEFNFISYKNEEVDQLLLDGRKTFDFEKRRNIYHRIHEILAEEQPYTFLYVPDALPVLHKRFKGVEKAPLGIWYDFIHWWVPSDNADWYLTP